MNPGSNHSYDALEQYYNIREKFSDLSTFSPKYLSFQSQHYEVNGVPGIDGSFDCLESGIHCLKDPDSILNGRISLKEAVRQKCIWSNFQGNWWQYVFLFRTTCLGKTGEKHIEECSYDLMGISDISKEMIRECYDNSFEGKSANNKNGLLQRDFLENDFRIFRAPAFVLNDFIHESEMDKDEFLDAVCDSLVDPPRKCMDVHSLLKKKRVWHIMWWVFLALAIFAGIFYVTYRMAIRKQIKTEMEDQVGTAVTLYLKFNEHMLKKKKNAKYKQLAKKVEMTHEPLTA